ncbi:hypothetical protein DEB41_13335 [Vibrio anguillarum]|nr:hypothetical protein VAA_00087 [Vibrio anguillarum 775]AGU59806.1 hypothetical protein N175_14610 [Vibrio anguillarum M3]ASF93686.1 hypothetical protein CEA93_16845 [Vibrio anguillarum]ATA51319.1 hypothetical protein CLI14_16785 [Vibrio anguillarum]AVT65858.1 hypothetical protein B5S57_01270 [Vibrio anguillarum]
MCHFGTQTNKQFKWILNAWQFYYALSKVFYGAMRWLGQCVVHHLIGRYATQVKLGVQSCGISPAIRFVLSANEYFYPKIRG